MKGFGMQQELIEMLEEIIQYVEVWNAHDQSVLDKAEALIEKAKNSAKEPAVPQGWKLVPVEPTDAMSIAGGIAWESSTADDVIGPIEDAWAAMLAASPEQNQAQPAQCVPEGRRLFDESMGESLQAEAMALFDKAEHGHVKCPAYFLHELAFTIGRLRAALAATPAPAPAQEAGLTDDEIKQACTDIYLSDHPQGSESYDIALGRAIIAALRAKGNKL